jgi:hypothetical protein
MDDVRVSVTHVGSLEFDQPGLIRIPRWRMGISAARLLARAERRQIAGVASASIAKKRRLDLAVAIDVIWFDRTPKSSRVRDVPYLPP